MQDPLSESAKGGPGIVEIFLGFFSVSVIGFGGVLPWARWLAVEQRKWLTPAEFNEAMALCQFLPGGNIINFSVVVGSKYCGVPGAIAGVVGLMIGPFFIMIGMASLYARFSEVPGVVGMLNGMSAAGAGLVTAMTIKMALELKEEYVPLLFAVAGFVAVGLFRVPLVYAIGVLAPLSILYAWRRVR
jgi:chromate transporter